jgi:ACS family D-galactonate transporter-like MFS transporter
MTTGPGVSGTTPPARRPGTGKASSLWAGKRLYVAIFLFFNLFINYMARTNLSVAAPVIAKEFHWNPATLGVIFSSFMWTYALCLIPWGWTSDRIGRARSTAYPSPCGPSPPC